tara:strand:+ start:1101 stop:1535 length:435 start_codon:yes stop_codon:yes gene_type:complete
MHILFLCVGNSARSQIAEGLAKHMLPNSFNIKSAGSNPTGKINKYAKSVMGEIGIDISDQSSKSIDDLDKNFLRNLDCVITLCAEEICPIIEKEVKIYNWALEDPANQENSKLDISNVFRKTRYDIFNLIKKFYLENSLESNEH